MQISTPTEALSSPSENGYQQETNSVGSFYGDSPLWGHRAQKKDKPGIFAKLLEGLIAKGKKGSSGSEKIEITDAEDEKSGENKLKTGLSTKKTRNFGREFPNGPEFFDENVVSGLLKHEWLAEQSLNRSIQAESKSIHPIRREFSGEINPKDGNILDLAAMREDDSFGILPRRSEKRDFEISKNSSGDKAKNARTAERQLAGRQLVGDTFVQQMESGFYQFQGRQGLTEKSGERDNSRLAEFRARRSRERLNIEVRDLRTAADTASSGGAGPEISKGQFLNALKPVHAELELPVDLNLSSGRGNEAGKTGGESPASRTFEDALASQLRGNLSTDIVRDATLIVRNGGEGTIRLSLRPASLGDVKIRLEMTENKITGHIIVESDEALRAFERELPVLEKAFKDSGFSETTLDMFLAQDHGNSGGGQQWQEGEYTALNPVLAASRYDAELDGTDRIDAPAVGGTNLPVSAGRKAVNLLV